MAIKKSVLLFFILSLFTSSISTAQLVCDTAFLKEYNAGGELEAYVTKKLSNGEVLVAGAGNLVSGGNKQGLVIKFASNGSIIWSKIIGGGVKDYFNGIIELSNGSYLLYGVTASFGNSSDKVLFVNINATGNVIWARQLGIAGNSNDRIKAAVQYTDGDIVGTFNIDDSATNSHPVVFKMKLDGSIQWTNKFDNNSEESFTTIAFQGNKIYAGGFYTTTNKTGVITLLDAGDGHMLSSENIYYPANSYAQEVTDLEIYNGEISYALWSKDPTQTVPLNFDIYVREDLSGKKLFGSLIDDGGDIGKLVCRRASDGGVYVLKTASVNTLAPILVKLNRFNWAEWRNQLSEQMFSTGQLNPGMDIAANGDAITAGFFTDKTNGRTVIKLIKITAAGDIPACMHLGNGISVDTASFLKRSFIWNTSLALNITLNQPIAPAAANILLNPNSLCDTVVCTDKTALPPPCNKTYLTKYTASAYTLIRDGVVTNDGGKIIVGEMNTNGMAAKINNNGDVAWAKILDEPNHHISFSRVIRSNDGNVFAFGNNAYVINHQVYNSIKIVKLAYDGTIISSTEIQRNAYIHIADVAASVDGGFVLAINEDYGSGHLYSHLVRFNGSLGVVWKKEIAHPVGAPVYRSVYCTADAVYLGFDSYDYSSQNDNGVQKVDYATGNQVWMKRLVVQNEYLLFNRITVANDTVYAFFNKFRFDPPANRDNHVTMLKLTTSGNIINAVQLNTDNTVPINSGYYFDFSPPTVTITPDNDFVLTTQVEKAGVKELNITRFDRNGNGTWSKNYPGLNVQEVYNIHPQDKGVIVMGASKDTKSLYLYFTNGFLLKTDSSGEIIAHATGACTTVQKPFNSTSVTFTELTTRETATINLDYFVLTSNAPLTETPLNLDATLYCNVQADCAAVTVGTKGNACSLTDTLTYFLTNTGGCGAAAIWTFDSSSFTTVLLKGDTLKLLPKKPGVSTITAEIQTPCYIKTQEMIASILVSASSMKLGNDTSICPGDTIKLNAGSGYESYQWNDLSTDSILKVTAPGTYFVRVTDHCGGASADTIIINSVNTAFRITANSTKCNADTLHLLVTAGFFNYQWSPIDRLTASTNTSIVNPVQTTRYYVKANTPSGCIVEDSILINVKTSPPINLGNDTAICYDQTLALTAGNGFSSYSWNTGSSFSSITVSAEGSYSIAATALNGCISKDTVIVSKHAFTKPWLGNDTSFCSGRTAVLFAGNYNAYSWSTNTNQSTINVNRPGMYWVKIIDQFGCNGSDTIMVLNVYQSPAGFLPADVSICFGEAALLQSNKDYASYLWSTGAFTRTIAASETGIYQLSVTDNIGCVGTDTINVLRKQDCPSNIFFYNAFTPNNDAKNELFKPSINGYIEKYALNIYDRFGELIFSTNDYLSGWNGMKKGKIMPSGNYVYTCYYKFAGKEAVIEKGNILLIR